MAARSLMFQGTGSDVGKSVLVAGLCRLFARGGMSVRPFKAQNMSNNAAVARCHDGGYGEIGRAQWLQALAAGAEPVTDMNPVLLKPMSDTGADIVVQGRSRGTASALGYQRLKASLLDAVLDSHARLAADCDLVLVEGAGSASEVNLRSGDIANMGFARAADVPVVLIGDIDRGGVIASLVGTHCVLPPQDRAMIAGTIVNKFRGDPALFAEGLATIERHTGWPSLGLVPWLTTVGRLPPEDSVALERPRPGGGARRVRIAVPQPGRIANFDDLDPLAATPGVEVSFVRPGEAIPRCDCILLPGTRATIADLAAFRRHGWDTDIARHHAAGGMVVGICGGFQMLGRRIDDPEGVEGPAGGVDGLGLLAVDTVMEPRKTVRPARLRATTGEELSGYEIHLGRTEGPGRSRPFAVDAHGPEGAVSADGRVIGTYLHGVFGNDAWRSRFLSDLGLAGPPLAYMAEVETALDAVADALEAALDVPSLLRLAR
ncbi:adenosylcobyric acid synthase (glutamine-hydrolysing) [Aureimonas altamirensis DSM 21988]|uniref:Cobyric acid synthase n=1 Tax=Aureimonas altamirensis DSM 21988 TaxID=1121026 RepID=A0ABY1IP04_9HYPH|nr:cobyric acid synthase [Aureimonas altamirensis]SHJ72302.1 adenosylcobyric acid synthase (glutamine-hydrolysing) [Aureimonas altamirensis DSM 21988]